MEHTTNTTNSPIKEKNFIHQNNMDPSLTSVPFIEKREREVRMKTCVEVVTYSYW